MTDPLAPWLNRIIHGDALDVMSQMPRDSIDLVVTSPPYNVRNSTGNGLTDRKGKWPHNQLRHGYPGHSDDMPRGDYVDWQRECLAEMLDLIKPTGAIFYVHRPRVQGGLQESPRDIVDHICASQHLRQEIIWVKNGGINHNRGYFTPSYEVIYLLVKKAKNGWLRREDTAAWTDVWQIPRVAFSSHPAPFPSELARRAIEASTGSVVLDPFMGSGSTAVAALEQGWDYIGIDIAEEYCRTAEARIEANRHGRVGAMDR